MTLKGFLFLFVVTVATVMLAGFIANEYIPSKGIERTLFVAFAAAIVVFPAAKWAERKGWVKGNLDLTKKNTPQAKQSEVEK